MGTLVLSPVMLVTPAEEIRPGLRVDAPQPDEAVAPLREARPVADLAGARATPRFDLDL